MARPARYISATEFQRSIGESIDDVRSGKQIIIVQSHGRDQVALLPVDRYQELLKREREAIRSRVSVVENLPQAAEVAIEQ